ncbi:Imm52 family immunity protein [Atlantibacter hermannii]|uniref:Imm52 family immunity protein n=2 Tax=Atlantibacter hermannii TaxID=565 RepID=UPI002550B721|nr:Imm52 family immunity protein [Atlantibacter hermannii]
MATMTGLFNTSINIHLVKESDITIGDCVNLLYKSALVVKKITKQDQIWYLTGHSKKEASQYIVFSGDKVNQNALDIFHRHYKKNYPLINESMWNGQPDGFACEISHFMKFRDNPGKVNLIIDMDQRVSNTLDMIDSLQLLTKENGKSWIKVDSKGYWLHNRNVFPDRIYVGWMLYIPHVLLPELIREAARVIPVIEFGKQKGTIIVSTEEIFDGSNKEHVGKANDIEIKLLDLGLLPLMTEL